MSGPRERTPRKGLDGELRRYVPAPRNGPPGNGHSGNGDGPSAHGGRPHGDGDRVHGADDGIAIVEQRAPMATPRKLGEILLMARQGKGIELERAARDTKIRSRYLAALESGEFRELPGSVYTKGFLRNYAQYLGLDPDVVVAHYRRELGGRGGERVSIVAKRLRNPRAGLTITPGLLVAGVLTIAVLLFAGYIALQFVRFVQPPVLTVTTPATAETTIDAETTTLAGSASPGASVTITGPDGPVNATATSAGSWSATVPLRKGRNEFLIVALDPQTTKKSAETRVIVLVPLPAASPAPQAPALSVSSPVDAATFTNGAIAIAGTTSGSTVSVSATYLGPPTTGVPAGTATPAPPPTPAAKAITVGSGGTFSGTYVLVAGQWRLTVSATGDAGLQTSVTRTVTVAVNGVKVLVEIKGGRVWLRVRIDGQLAKQTPTNGGIVFNDGAKLTFTGKQLVEIRSGVPSHTYVTVNGISYGALSGGSINSVWAIGPVGGPKPE